MTKRFDRVDGSKVHMQTLAALAHIDYNTPRLCSYELAASYMKQIGLGANEVEQFYRRMVFNVLAVNRDDHVKNVSFLMNRDGIWKLSPAYDVTFSYNPTNKWLRAHQMTVNGKQTEIRFRSGRIRGQEHIALHGNSEGQDAQTYGRRRAERTREGRKSSQLDLPEARAARGRPRKEDHPVRRYNNDGSDGQSRDGLARRRGRDHCRSAHGRSEIPEGKQAPPG
jgi:serine/threonine protein kinase HipA of HipAB toxin-antitoxin module